MESSAAMDDGPPSPSRDRNLVDDDNCEVRSPHPGLGSDSFSFSSSSVDEVYDEKLPRVSVKQRNNSLQWQNKTLYDYGIGKKLLEKMGYKLERGLGKNEQGITEPIIAKGRPCPRMGLGYHDPKERQRQRLRPEKPKVSKALPVSEGRVERNLWSKRAVGKEKTKQEDRTAGGDVLKVVDMRGPQPRVLTNLVNSNAEEGAKTEGLLMPELQHNIRLIVDLIGFDISKISEDLWREREALLGLKDEKDSFKIEMAKQKKQSDSLEEITSLINQVGEDVLMETLTLESLSTCFSDLQKKYGKDYKLCNLSCIACSFALPLFIRVFQDWDPLRNPSYGLELVSSWKALLQGEGSFDIWKPTSLYAQLLHEVVVPAIKSSVINTWEARNPEPMLRFLDSWKELLPSSILDTILDDIVKRKLKNAVDSWEPQREVLPIHDWVSPWLPLLGHKLEDVYQTLVSKLTGAWHPSADSAFAILSCWKTVFDSSSWERLMSRFVLPKLQHLLQEVQVNSTNQHLDRFHWFSSWAPVLPIHLVVEMMEKFFFPKWLEFLYQWLCSNPNFGQVTEWYFGWKDLLPKELLANEDILYQLKFGLDMMDRAVEGRKVVWPLMKENLSHVRDLEQRQFEAQQKAVRFYQRATTSFHETANMDGMSSVPELSLKEVVEVYAQQHGLLFKPKVGRMHNGLQIYGFGSRSIIVDSRYERVYAQMEKTWSLVTLKQLLDVHNSSHSMRY